MRLGADMRIAGRYTLEGKALKFLPVTGDGDFTIDLKGCSLSAISFFQLVGGVGRASAYARSANISVSTGLVRP